MTFVTDCIPCYRNSFFFYFFFIFLLSFAPLDLDHPTRKKKKRNKVSTTGERIKNLRRRSRETNENRTSARKEEYVHNIYTYTGETL